jgi:hypothetical protein
MRNMRFLTMVKSAETQGPPPPALMEAIAKLGEEGVKTGVLTEAGGLYPTALGARIRLTGGELKVTDGPFTEAKEVVGGYAFYSVRSKDEALKLATRFMELHKQHWKGWNGECEIRQVYEEEFPPKKR